MKFNHKETNIPITVTRPNRQAIVVDGATNGAKLRPSNVKAKEKSLKETKAVIFKN